MEGGDTNALLFLRVRKIFLHREQTREYLNEYVMWQDSEGGIG